MTHHLETIARETGIKLFFQNRLHPHIQRKLHIEAVNRGTNFLRLGRHQKVESISMVNDIAILARHVRIHALFDPRSPLNHSSIIAFILTSDTKLYKYVGNERM